MNLNQTRILISDIRRFGEVAFLVDRDDFVNDVEKTRRELGIVKLLERNQADKLWNKQHPIPAGAKNVHPVVKNTIVEKELDIDRAVKELLTKYKKGWGFYNVIKYTIACGSVENTDYANRLHSQSNILIYGGPENKPCYYVLPLPPEYKNSFKNMDSSIKLDVSEAAIIINPETAIEDVEKCFNLLKADIEKNYPHWKLPDTISNIKRDREWYWLKKQSGLGYGKTFNLIESKETITFEGFKKAVQQYGKRLTG